MSSAKVIIQAGGGIRGLQDDLRKLVNNPESSDVVFVCEDGIEVHACRLLLTVRSSFFSKMLQNGMAESGKSIVSLPTVESSVFIVILKYLFTGELPEENLCCSSNPMSSDHENGVNCNTSAIRFNQLDWNLVMKIVVAAHFFMLDGLHLEILERLGADIPPKCAGGVGHTDLDSIQTEIVLKLSVLCERPQLWKDMGEVMIKSMDEIGSALVDILALEDLSPVTLLSMSKEAFDYYLTKTRKASRQEADEFPDWSIEEYLKLRTILLWCAVQSIRPCDVYSFYPACLPGRKRVFQYLEGDEKPSQIFSIVDAYPLSLDREALVNAIDTKMLEQFLEMVELSSIHPELLFTVIKPLGIIRPELLSKAFGEQAMITTWWMRKLKISKEQKLMPAIGRLRLMGTTGSVIGLGALRLE